MSFTSLEWIVLIFTLIGLIKLAVILVNKKQWLPVVEALYGNPRPWSFIFLVLSGVVAYFLLQELTIIQILATMAFTSLIIAVAFLQYGQEFMKIAKKMINKKFGIWLWIYILVWIVLMVWGLKEIFS
jgi:hypothetical protein